MVLLLVLLLLEMRSWMMMMMMMIATKRRSRDDDKWGGAVVVSFAVAMAILVLFLHVLLDQTFQMMLIVLALVASVDMLQDFASTFVHDL
jgi:predicted membrane metal-binding protein